MSKQSKASKGTGFNPAKFLETAAKGRANRTYRKKEVIFKQGDDADSVIYIRKGNVKVCVLSKDARRAGVDIARLVKGEVLPAKGPIVAF